MMTGVRPAVEAKPPPEAVLKVINPVLRAALRSPLQRVFGDALMILHVTGRRSGKQYDVVVGRNIYEGQVLLSLGGRWRVNLRPEADVTATIGGRTRRGHVTVIDDPDRVAEIFTDLVRQLGRRHANRLGMRVNVDRLPTLDEVAEATRDRWVGVLELEP